MNLFTSTPVPVEQGSPSRQVRRAEERRQFKALRSAVKQKGGAAAVGRPSA